MAEKFERSIAITGGAGFIGANFLHYMTEKYPRYLFVNIDSLTYAANPRSLENIEKRNNYRFIRIDITNRDRLFDFSEKYDLDGIIHLAAETHVDHSIKDPTEFINTNILGTFNLLEISRHKFSIKKDFRFLNVSTDEVYGSLGQEGIFSESSPYRPNSPYAATKAAADHLVRAYNRTYGIDTVTTNCGNNFGPFQYPEKLIPLVICNARDNKPIPIYGDGRNIRDWMYVVDHCRAVDYAFHRGKKGAGYNISSRNEIENIELVRKICRHIDRRLGGGPREKLITFVRDRLGHDRRYAIDPSAAEIELGWKPQYDFESALAATVDWYLDNEEWLAGCIDGRYRKYYEDQYQNL